MSARPQLDLPGHLSSRNRRDIGWKPMPFVAGAAEAPPPIRTIPPHEALALAKEPGFEDPRHVLPRVSAQAARDLPPAFTGGARSGSSPPLPATATHLHGRGRRCSAPSGTVG